MKILLSANTAWNLAHFRKPVIEALLADGHVLLALAPSGADRRPEDLGVPLHPVRIDSKGMSPLSDARLTQTYRTAFRQEAPDLVLSYTIKPNIYGGLAARTLGQPFLPNVSGLGTAFLGGNALEAVAVQLYRHAFRTLPHVVFQNGDDRDLFLERGIVREDQAIMVPGSGVDLAHYGLTDLRDTDDDAVTFLMIGRLLRDKGVEELVAAARIVRRHYPKARVQLLGETGSQNRSAIDAETVSAWVEEGVIEYLGQQDDVRPHIAAADCIVLPSYREGTPRTLLEAAAMGRPLVATDVPGCREVVDDGRTGYLCRMRDAVDLAGALLKIIAIGPEGRAKLGHAGRKKMEQQFDQRIVVDIYRDLVDRMTARR